MFHIGCRLRKKRVMETEAWKLANLLETLTDEGKLDWTMRAAGGGNAQHFDAQMGTMRFTLSVNVPDKPYIMLRIDSVTTDICFCYLFGLYASATLVIAAKEIEAAEKRRAERETAVGQIRERVEKLISEMPTEESVEQEEVG